MKENPHPPHTNTQRELEGRGGREGGERGKEREGEGEER